MFDSEGFAVAYVNVEDELTIYLWGRRPVAYLTKDGALFNIYGFNGSHLGWLENGIVRDHQGYGVGFLSGAVSSVIPKLEPLKGLKQLKPLKSIKRLAPPKPLDRSQWSATPLSLFLAAGR